MSHRIGTPPGKNSGKLKRHDTTYSGSGSGYHASFFVSSEKKIKVANEMKQKKTIGSSIGLLTGAVIANLALLWRGSIWG